MTKITYLSYFHQLIDAKYYIRGKTVLVDDKRLGQLKWLTEQINPELFGKLNKRIECLTDYTTETAEGYQLVNYGVGGHFSVHIDAFSDVRNFLFLNYNIFGLVLTRTKRALGIGKVFCEMYKKIIHIVMIIIQIIMIIIQYCLDVS